jgi:hypothetical protein
LENTIESLKIFIGKNDSSNEILEMVTDYGHAALGFTDASAKNYYSPFSPGCVADFLVIRTNG